MTRDNGTRVAHADMDIMSTLLEVQRLADRLIRDNQKLLAAVKLVAFCRDCNVCRGVCEAVLRELVTHEGEP